MNSILIKKLCFGFGEKIIFENLDIELAGEGPTVILGPSGCGKTTLLRLMAGLLKPRSGEISIEDGSGQGAAGSSTGAANLSGPAVPSTGPAFVFQEPRLLPWKTVLENVSLPIERLLGGDEAEDRARHYLKLVSLGDSLNAFPDELSGGQKQRVSLARAFAYPASTVLMDEAFQSLDIPLRRHLLDLTLALLKDKPRRLVAVTHDPREALYLGGEILILGRPGEGIVFKRTVDPETRTYSPAELAGLEKEMLACLENRL
jgi:NitT/TauT family transport system ATP-binding protein